MQYKIIIDTQSRTNPTDDKKEYVIDIEELRYKDGVYDTLVLSINDGCYIIRRLSLSKTHVLTILDEEVTETIDDIDIELFEGDNYVYIEDMEGNPITAEYIIDNEFTSLYVTTVQLNSAITQTAEEISLEVSKKVGEDEIISKINQSAEEITIQADKISLEGYTTINEGFAIDEEGNASIANGAVCINTEGIQMADGTSIIGGKGIYTNLQYVAVDGGTTNVSGQLGFWFYGDYDVGEVTYLRIYTDIPSNFTVISAYITIIHRPITWHYYNVTNMTGETQLGYARNVQIYIDSLTAGEDIYLDSEADPITITPRNSNNGIR